MVESASTELVAVSEPVGEEFGLRELDERKLEVQIYNDAQ